MATLHQEARAVFHQLGFSPSKARGQNFLVHRGTIEKILRLVDVQPDDDVVEIGPGIGFLTRALLPRCRAVWGIEVDDRLVEWLRSSALGSTTGFYLIHADVLSTDFSRFVPPHRVKVVANLPYSIATAVIAHIFENAHHFSELTVMVQKEVAQRLAAVPGGRSYGPLAILLAVHGQITRQFPVAPEAFVPRPSVQSTVLHVRIKVTPSVPPDELPLFRRVVRTVFGRRRKMLLNSLLPLVARGREEVDKILREVGIDGKRRAETLSLEEFVSLARAVGDYRGERKIGEGEHGR